MNWDAIGSVAEVIGAIAVVASLVYLGGQIQQNTKQLRIAGRQASQSSLQGTILSQTEPATADLIVRGFDGYLQLSKADKFRFNVQMLNMLLDGGRARMFDRFCFRATPNHCMQPTPQTVIKFAYANLPPAWRAAQLRC